MISLKDLEESDRFFEMTTEEKSRYIHDKINKGEYVPIEQGDVDVDADIVSKVKN